MREESTSGDNLVLHPFSQCCSVPQFLAGCSSWCFLCFSGADLIFLPWSKPSSLYCQGLDPSFTAPQAQNLPVIPWVSLGTEILLFSGVSEKPSLSPADLQCCAPLFIPCARRELLFPQEEWGSNSRSSGAGL